MRTRKRIIGLVSAAASATLALVACGEDLPSERRPGFELPDAGPEAAPNLPPSSPADDGGVDANVPEKRDPFDPADEPVVCGDAGACAKQIVAGSSHFCALLSDGTVRCWGSDDYGALGGGEPPKDPPPKGLPDDAGATVTVAIKDATQLSAAGKTTCARTADGSVMCWGRNSQGQLGLDDARPTWDEDRHPTPAPVAIHEPAVRVDVGESNACAVLATGKVSCWGTNERAQLARPDAELAWVLGPALASLDPKVVTRTAIGSTTVLGVTSAGEVISWGATAGGEGLLGGRMTSVSPDPVPNELPLLASVTSIAASGTLLRYQGGWPPQPPIRLAHACALAAGEVYCWGKSERGALCTGLPDAELLPAHAPIEGKAWPQQLAVGSELTCARMTDGAIQCCGAHEKGRLGTGQKDPFSAFFVPIASFKGYAVQVAASEGAVCALVKDGSVECWGSNTSGELATGATDDDPHPSPVKIAF